jgi:hypothetical protein
LGAADAAQANTFRPTDVLRTTNAQKKELQLKKKVKGGLDLVEETVFTSVQGECGMMTSRKVVCLRGWKCLETRRRTKMSRECWDELVQENQ